MAWLLLWIVQSLSLAALAALAGRLGSRRVRPAVQHVVWQCALACMAVLALAGLGTAGVAMAPDAPVAAAAGPAPAPFVLPALPAWAATAFLAIWGAGAVWLGLRLGGQLVRIRRLKRACVVMAGSNLRRVPRLASAARDGRRARFCWCDQVDGPSMLGFGRPVIALPRGQADALDWTDLEQVLLHELAHVRRRDDWTALAEHVLAVLLWINPAVHWARRGLSIAREMACDDWVIRRTAAPVAYARCLTRVAALRLHHGDDRLVAAAVGSRRVLSRRVAWAVDGRTRPSARISRVAFALAPTLTGLLGVAILAMPPLVVDGVGPTTIRVEGAAAQPSTVFPSGRADAAEAQTSQARATARRAASAPQTAVGAERRRGSSLAGVSPADVPATVQHGEAEPLEGEVRLVVPDVMNAQAANLVLWPPLDTREAGDLLMSPRDGVSAPLVTAGSDEPAWWSKASGAAGTLGDGAVSAGRSTASFFRRAGGALSNSIGR